MINLFTKHPNSIGETYFQHFRFAFIFGLNMILGGCACMLHAFFPFLFPKTGSRQAIKVVHHMVERMHTIEKPVADLSQSIERRIVQSNQ